MSAALVIRSERLSMLANDLYDANAFGDRGRFLAAINRLRNLVGDIDPTMLAGFVSRLVEWLGANPEFVAIVKRLFGAFTSEQFSAALKAAGDPGEIKAACGGYLAPATDRREDQPTGQSAGRSAGQSTDAQVSLLAADFSVMSDAELHAAGILDTPGAWLSLIRAILALVQMFR